MNRSTVATGVGGGAGWQALAWALEEAANTESRLEICHVCPVDSPLTTHTGTVPVGLLELADPPLARAVAAAKARLGGDRVTLSVHTGRVENALLRISEYADLMVLGAGGRTTHQVAAHAQCPTVVVRPDTTTRRGPFTGHVVVGVDSSPPSQTALELGFAFAAAHHRPLAAVHVVPHDGGDVIVAGAHDMSAPHGRPTLHGGPASFAGSASRDESAPDVEARDESRDPLAGLALLTAEVEPWTREYPSVTVTRAVFADRPLPGLLRAAAGARLLVVGHRGHGPLARTVLGSVAHGVIDRAAGPAAVTHTRDAHVSLFDSSVSYRELLRERA